MQLFPALPEVVQGTFRPAPFGRLERRDGSPCERGIFIVNHTTNYQLSQWESTDRILMEDFNSDNAKIDAALKNQADAIAALTQTVSGKASASALEALEAQVGPKLIGTQTVSASTNYWNVQLGEVDWSAWSMVRVVCKPVLSSGGNYEAQINGSYRYSLGSNVTGPCVVLLFPGRDPALPTVGLGWTSEGMQGFMADTVFENLATVTFSCRSGTLEPGTAAQIWGVK